MDFEAIPGVGAKTADALTELDGSVDALETGDVATLARAPNISEGRAAAIARAAIRIRHDDPGGFLATDRARELYRDVLTLLQARAVTTYAEKRLKTLYPSATASRIEEVHEFTARAMKREPTAEIQDALAGVEPLSNPRDVTVRDRCLATTDAERYAEARKKIPELPVEVVEDARELAELARGYSTVVALDESFTGVTIEGDVRVEPDALETPAELVPERPLAFFAENRETLLAAVEVHQVAGMDAPLDIEELESALARVTTDGSVTGDDELARLTDAIADLDAGVSMAENVANDRLRDAIRERDVTIEGSDLLSLVEQGAGVDSLLSRELADEYDAAIEAAREHLIDTLSLDAGETEIARQAFPDEPSFPVEHDESVIARLREQLEAEKSRREERHKRDLAQTLADERESAEELVHAALELDVELAVSRFARDFDCVLPEFETGGNGFEIVGGRSPLLDVDFSAVEPVDYGVSGVALLSGVNSGGKTSTLDLVALIVILAQMGLPVPAESVRLGRFEELHYHGKTQGTLDAGAFESTLREFASLADGEAGRLVLVDELESITEPGASAKIIAGILEELGERDVTGVFVSHLADEIRDVADEDVAVDGIEAKGLVDGELVVERSPVKNHLARSTPELIVEKLADGGESGFYERLLEKFE
ncbi:DNA mismatch repair protein, MutS family [Haladaptatus litoreus]|uniref:DNA-binding protein MutS2 n=1 Tax=Haladaptatus litoreus TaxID=553468 RepID=A0A1N7BG55_9EURY|nr:DNA mismatch repair protein MutS [Haladaptatus litoreus]SIR50320.1 DNA mismatch repair protein, MutS family [Haladaptatus litoreus]